MADRIRPTVGIRIITKAMGHGMIRRGNRATRTNFLKKSPESHLLERAYIDRK